jgi:signal peptidase
MNESTPMTAMAQRFGTRFQARPVLSASLAVAGALVFAYWFSREFLPGRVYSLWGPYFLGPMAWMGAAGVAYRATRQLPPNTAEHEVDRRTVLMVALLIGLFLVSLQFITGMVAGFGRSPYAHTPRFLAINALFAGSLLLATETSRTALLRALGPRSMTLALVLVTLGLAALQFGEAQYTGDGFRQNAEFWGALFIPTAAAGLLGGFFAVYGGTRAALLIAAPLVVFQFYSPILPNVEWPVQALVGVAGPAMGLWIAEGLFAAEEPGTEAESRGFFSLPSIAWVLTAVISLVIFWFSFGFFGFRPAFVPSHSMEPLIQQGDVVLLGPISAGEVAVGDIVMYELSNRQRVLHRVHEITTGENGERIFIFKGDNNNTTDPMPVTDKQLVGEYRGRVPKVGWIPIKFNQLAGKVR